MRVTRRCYTTTILQMDPVESGPACLGMLLGYYGKFLPLFQLREACGVSRDGSKPSKLVAAARYFGLSCQAFNRPDDSFKRTPLPCMVFWQLNHYVVVEGYTSKVVFLNDPAEGHRQVSWAVFLRDYTGLVLSMKPGPDFRKGGSRPSFWKPFLRRLQGTHAALLVAFLCGVMLVLPGLVLPTLIGVYLDNVIGQGRIDWLGPLLTALTAAMAMQLVLKILQLTYLRKLKIFLDTRLSSQFVWHLLRLPSSYYTQRHPGDVSDRSKMNKRVATVVAEDLAGTLIELFTMIVYGLVMFYYDDLLTLLAIAFASLNFCVLRWVARHRIEANMRLGQQQAKANSVAYSCLQGIETLKATGGEARMFALWAGQFTKYLNAFNRLQLSTGVLSVLPRFLTMSAYTMVLILGAFRVLSGDMSIGMLVAYQRLMQTFLAPLGNLVNLGRTFQELQGDLSRLDDVLVNPSQEIETVRELPADPTAPRLRGHVEIRNLTFGYCRVDAPLIENFNLSVPPGKRVALVGPSGSGRSTISRLLVGLYTPWNGETLFDGRPPEAYPRWILKNAVGFIDQDVYLFEGTVRENLTLWDDDIPESQLAAACRDACIYDEVVALPGGFDALLDEAGANLSSGQRQRLEIARALLHNPSVLVLDEATSSLDAETERLILDAFHRRGCTCIVVAHRLSAFRDCDEIILLEQGKVVERGDHAGLMAAAGRYATLIRAETSLSEPARLGN